MLAAGTAGAPVASSVERRRVTGVAATIDEEWFVATGRRDMSLGKAMIGRQSSLRLDLLRFPLIVGVVFIHNFESTVRLAGGNTLGTNHLSPLVEFTRNLISHSLAPAAVPAFFLISGYLFFAGFDFTTSAYIGKLRSRVRTLLVPLLFWNVLMLVQWPSRRQFRHSGHSSPARMPPLRSTACSTW